jgi:MFS family permease
MWQTDMGDYDPLDPKADQTKKGWLTSILELGAWLGTLLSGFLAEAISRKYGILVACAVFVIGVVIQATAISAGHQAILAGRFIT